MKIKKPVLGVIALARSTFDVPFAEEVAEKAWKNLSALDAELIGSRQLSFDAEAVKENIERFKAEELDLLLILQVTFTDAVMTTQLAKTVKAPVLIWSFPENRAGDRLRLNSLCGANLAGHALGKADTPFDYLHQPADHPEANQKILSLTKASSVVKMLAETRLGVIGEHPDGFDTCVYDQEALKNWCGVTVERHKLSDFLQQAATVPESQTEQAYRRVDREVTNLAEMEQEPLRKSMSVYAALKALSEKYSYQGLAVRCWPEFFTELGCAACGAMSMMNEDQIVCGCEADLFGVLTTLILQWLGEAPAFMADLVDISSKDNTGVFWHCGLAPVSMADPEGEVKATVHTNRKKPFLYEFTLKPGRVTFARISQSKNKLKMVIGGGEMVRAPMSYTGTSGVVQFDISVDQVLENIMHECLEHHYSLSYGEHKATLRRLADLLNIPVLEIS